MLIYQKRSPLECLKDVEKKAIVHLEKNVEKCSIASKLQETDSPEDILNWLLSTTATATGTVVKF